MTKLMSIQVSVVVPTCKRPELLDRCLRALTVQTFDPASYEIIVVDDAGDETTRQVVEGWAAQAETIAYLPVQETGFSLSSSSVQASPVAAELLVRGAWLGVAGVPHLRYLYQTERRGPAAARNRGWQAAQGEIIAFTDDDCIPAPDWLEMGVSCFGPQVLGVSGRVVVPLTNRPTDYELDAAGLARSVFVTANCFYRKEALAAVGGFDETFTLAWREDSDLYFRILGLDGLLIEAPGAVVVHPVRPALWGVSLKQQRKSMFNALLYRKHPALYRQRIQPHPPWLYYTCLASLAILLAAILAHNPDLAILGAAAWISSTLIFAARRLRGTSHGPSHVVEILLTSALIPPVSVFWRLLGAVKFRVFFL